MKTMITSMLAVAAITAMSADANAGDRWGWNSHHNLHHGLQYNRQIRRQVHHDAHHYPMTRFQHRSLHQDLRHDAYHDRLNHRSFHNVPRYGFGGGSFSVYGGGFGYSSPGYGTCYGR